MFPLYLMIVIISCNLPLLLQDPIVTTEVRKATSFARLPVISSLGVQPIYCFQRRPILLHGFIFSTLVREVSPGVVVVRPWLRRLNTRFALPFPPP